MIIWETLNWNSHLTLNNEINHNKELNTKSETKKERIKLWKLIGLRVENYFLVLVQWKKSQRKNVNLHKTIELLCVKNTKTIRRQKPG